MKSLNIAGRLGSLAPIRRAGVNGRIAFQRFNPEMVGPHESAEPVKSDLALPHRSREL
jgi:hypothetical protein